MKIDLKIEQILNYLLEGYQKYEKKLNMLHTILQEKSTISMTYNLSSFRKMLFEKVYEKLLIFLLS